MQTLFGSTACIMYLPRSAVLISAGAVHQLAKPVAALSHTYMGIPDIMLYYSAHLKSASPQSSSSVTTRTVQDVTGRDWQAT